MARAGLRPGGRTLDLHAAARLWPDRWEAAGRLRFALPDLLRCLFNSSLTRQLKATLFGNPGLDRAAAWTTAWTMDLLPRPPSLRLRPGTPPGGLRCVLPGLPRASSLSVLSGMPILAAAAAASVLSLGGLWLHWLSAVCCRWRRTRCSSVRWVRPERPWEQQRVCVGWAVPAPCNEVSVRRRAG